MVSRVDIRKFAIAHLFEVKLPQFIANTSQYLSGAVRIAISREVEAQFDEKRRCKACMALRDHSRGSHGITRESTAKEWATFDRKHSDIPEDEHSRDGCHEAAKIAELLTPVIHSLIFHQAAMSAVWKSHALETMGEFLAASGVSTYSQIQMVGALTEVIALVGLVCARCVYYRALGADKTKPLSEITREMIAKNDEKDLLNMNPNMRPILRKLHEIPNWTHGRGVVQKSDFQYDGSTRDLKATLDKLWPRSPQLPSCSLLPAPQSYIFNKLEVQPILYLSGTEILSFDRKLRSRFASRAHVETVAHATSDMLGCDY